jgi:hypothetical protein
MHVAPQIYHILEGKNPVVYAKTDFLPCWSRFESSPLRCKKCKLYTIFTFFRWAQTKWRSQMTSGANMPSYSVMGFKMQWNW